MILIFHPWYLNKRLSWFKEKYSSMSKKDPSKGGTVLLAPGREALVWAICLIRLHQYAMLFWPPL